MASGGTVFSMLYQLASLDDSKTMQQIRRLVHLIPTDPSVVEALDAVSYHSSVLAASSSSDHARSLAVSAAKASPKASPRRYANFKTVLKVLKNIESFDI